VGAEVIGRRECVIYIGKSEKLLANRGWNGDYFSINLNHSVTLKVEALCFSGTREEPFTDGVDLPYEHYNLRNDLKTCTVYSTCSTMNVFNVDQGQWADCLAKLHLLCI